MILLKYKDIKLLVDDNMCADVFISNIPAIEEFNAAAMAYAESALHATAEDTARIKALKKVLANFIDQSKVIGFPFDLKDAELHAIDKGIKYTELVIHGNAGNQNAAGEVPLDGHLNGRVNKRQKAAWVKQAQREQEKMMPWVIKTLNAAIDDDLKD